jgi:hypothetical protein
LLRCISPVVALGVFHCGAQNFDAIGGTADIDWPPAPIAMCEILDRLGGAFFLRSLPRFQNVHNVADFLKPNR